jgi:hypothetical protein
VSVIVPPASIPITCIWHQRKGRQRTPYDVVADVTEADGRPTLVSRCTCPMGYGCKHVAAMMLVWLHQRRRPDRPREQVLAWVKGFRETADSLAKDGTRKRRPASVSYALRYVVEPSLYGGDFSVKCHKVRLDQHGEIRQHEPWSNIERALQAPPAFVDDTDLDLLRLLWAHRARSHFDASDGLPLEGRHSDELMRRLLASGRAHFGSLAGRVLELGEPRAGTPDWTITPDGLRAPVLRVEPAADRVLALLPPWYIDTARAEGGPITLQVSAELVQRLLWLPALTQAESELVAETLAEVAPALPAPTLRGEPPIELGGAPVPVLRLETRPSYHVRFRQYAPHGTYLFDFAQLAFRYGAVTVEAGDARLFHPLPDGRSARLSRDEEAERAAAQRLAAAGFARIPPGAVQTSFGSLPADALGLTSEAAWPDFMAETVPALRAEGWEVAFPTDFRHHAIDIDHLMLDIDEHEDGWLGLSPGIEIDGKALPLAPLLAGLFAHDPRWLSGRLDDIDDHEAVILEELRPYQLEGLAWLQHLRTPRPGRHPGRRHGAGQDRADAGPPADREAGRPARPPGPGGAADLAGVQLASRGRALRPDAASVLTLHGADRSARFDERIPQARRGAHHLPAAVARRIELLQPRATGTCSSSTRRRR